MKKEVKTRIKNPKLIAKNRKQIIQGAIKAFSAKGFHDATIRDIAQASNLTMGSLSRYLEGPQRTPSGAGLNAEPPHSQPLEAWFAPGPGAGESGNQGMWYLRFGPA